MTAPAAPAERAARIVAIARAWIGTPYRHGASRIGAGADCLGLVRGVWRGLLGPEPEPPPPYAPDWMLGDPLPLEAALDRHFARTQRPQPGDVLGFRLGRAQAVVHLGILASGPEAPAIIHAYSGRGVVETALTPAWNGRCLAAFRFPEGSP